MKKFHTETLEPRSLLAAAADKSYWESFTDLTFSALKWTEKNVPFVKDIQEHPIPAVAAGLYGAVSAINAYHAFGHTLGAIKNGLPTIKVTEPVAPGGVMRAPTQQASYEAIFGRNDADDHHQGGIYNLVSDWSQNMANELSVPGNVVLSSDLIQFIKSDEFINASGNTKEGLYNFVAYMIENDLVYVDQIKDVKKLSNFLSHAFTLPKGEAEVKKLHDLSRAIKLKGDANILSAIQQEVQKSFGVGETFTSQATLEDTIEFLQDTEEEIKENGMDIANSFKNKPFKFTAEWLTFLGMGFAVPQAEKLSEKIIHKTFKDSLSGGIIHKAFGIDGSMATDSARKIFKNSRFGSVLGPVGTLLQYGFTADAMQDNYNDAFETLVAYEKRGYAQMLSDALSYSYYNPATAIVKTGGFMLDNYLFAGVPLLNKWSSGLLAESEIKMGSSIINLPLIAPSLSLIQTVTKSLITKNPLVGAALSKIGASAIGGTLASAGASVGVIAPVVLAMDIAYPLVEDAAVRLDKLWNYKAEGYDSLEEAAGDLSYRFYQNLGDKLAEGWENSKLKRLGNTAYEIGSGAASAISAIGSSAASATWNYGIPVCSSILSAAASGVSNLNLGQLASL